MNIFLGIAAVLILAVSIYADYKWGVWMHGRRREHGHGRSKSS